MADPGRIDRDALLRAGLEALHMELEHDSNVEPVLATHGMAFEDVTELAKRAVGLMVENYSKQNPTLPSRRLTLWQV